MEVTDIFHVKHTRSCACVRAREHARTRVCERDSFMSRITLEQAICEHEQNSHLPREVRNKLHNYVCLSERARTHAHVCERYTDVSVGLLRRNLYVHTSRMSIFHVTRTTDCTIVSVRACTHARTHVCLRDSICEQDSS